MNSIQALAKLMHAKTGVDLQAGDKVSRPSQPAHLICLAPEQRLTLPPYPFAFQPSMKMMYKLARFILFIPL